MARDNDDSEQGCSKLVGFLLVVVLLTLVSWYNGVEEVITIKDSYASPATFSANRYFIETMDGRIFVNADNWLVWKASAPWLQAKLKPGMKVRVFRRGGTIPIFKLYANILEVREVLPRPQPTPPSDTPPSSETSPSSIPIDGYRE